MQYNLGNQGEQIHVFVFRVDVRLGSNNWGNRNTPAKAASTGVLSRQKSSGGKADYLSSSPAQSSQKGKQDPVTKHSGLFFMVLVSFGRV